MFKNARTHLNFIYPRIFCLLMPILLVGCYVVHRGLYDASEIAGGWSSRQGGGLTYFIQPMPKKPGWMISTYSNQKGNLYFNLGSTAWDPTPFFRSVTFSGDTIRITFHDSNDQEKVISAKDFVSYHCQTLKVGDSEDFTVILPPFAIGDTNIPALSAHFRWSDRKYRQWVPLQ